MAKKFGKFLLFTAVAGAVAAGTYYYMQNKTTKTEEDDDDFDDFDEYDEDDLDEDEDASGRSYVSLDLENAEAAAVSKEKEAVSSAEKKVEEFFDDEDPSLDAM